MPNNAVGVHILSMPSQQPGTEFWLPLLISLASLIATWLLWRKGWPEQLKLQLKQIQLQSRVDAFTKAVNRLARRRMEIAKVFATMDDMVKAVEEGSKEKATRAHMSFIEVYRAFIRPDLEADNWYDVIRFHPLLFAECRDVAEVIWQHECRLRSQLGAFSDAYHGIMDDPTNNLHSEHVSIMQEFGGNMLYVLSDLMYGLSTTSDAELFANNSCLPVQRSERSPRIDFTSAPWKIIGTLDKSILPSEQQISRSHV